MSINGVDGGDGKSEITATITANDRPSRPKREGSILTVATFHDQCQFQLLALLGCPQRSPVAGGHV